MSNTEDIGMKKLVKLALEIIGADLAATSVVAVKNVVEENRQTGSKRRKGFYEKYVKRPMDFFLASGALVVLSPLLAGTAVAVRTKLGSPVLFTQDRPGKDGKIFKLYKFRTMTDERDANGELLPDEVRLTKFGKLLRSTSLDELPELVNIICGDMALIGPRPLLPEYIPFYTKEERHRHDVRPGLTGIAQVNGRNASSWEQTLLYDTDYVRNITMTSDVIILCKTAYKVIKRADVVQGVDNTIGRLDDYRQYLKKDAIELEK